VPAPTSVRADLSLRGPGGTVVVRGRGQRVVLDAESWGAFWSLLSTRPLRRILLRSGALANEVGIGVYLSLPGLPALAVPRWLLARGLQRVGA